MFLYFTEKPGEEVLLLTPVRKYASVVPGRSDEDCLATKDIEGVIGSQMSPVDGHAEVIMGAGADDAAVGPVKAAHLAAMLEIPRAEALPAEIRIWPHGIAPEPPELHVQISKLLHIVGSLPTEAVPEDKSFG